MITGLFSQPNYVAAKKLLDAAVLRHEAIASNLANVETPNYKRMDVAPSFQADLQEAIKGQNSGQLAAIEPHLETDSTALSNTRDGNSVQLEPELAKLNQNFLEHALNIQLVTGSLVKMRLAITGRPV